MLEARDLAFRHRPDRRLLDGVSLRIAPGETVGLSGPSGCGKTTLGRLLAGCMAPARGAVLLDGAPLPRAGCLPVQYLPQTPILAMNPRWRIGAILREAFVPDEALLSRLGIEPLWHRRFPHELSGGELARVSIARALAPGLRFLVADEVTSALDPVAQARIWRALLALARERGIGILAVSHDEALLRRLAGRRLALSATGALTDPGRAA